MANKDDDDLLQKADALMQRRRIFVAGANDAPEANAVAAPPDSDEDIPLLTEVVGPDALSTPSTTAQIDVPALHRALAAELESWIDNDLPTHVQRVLDGITDQMILQLSGKARAELLPRLQEALSTARQGAEPDAADE